MTNIHAHGKPRNCSQRCSLCCGYTTPGVIAFLIFALEVAHLIYMIWLAAVNPRVGWKVFLCVLFILLSLPAAAMALFSYYRVICSSPGFVPPVPWTRPPRLYEGDPTLVPEVHTGGVFARGGGGEEERADVLSLPPDAPVSKADPNSATAAAASGSQRGSGSGGSNPLLCDDTAAAAVAVEDPERGRRGREDHSPLSADARASSYNSNNDGGGADAGEEAENPYWVVERARDGAARYCAKCRQFKPDKSHHCSACGRCVYNFDHHCPFINNCVGRNNYKLFVLFLAWSGGSALFVCVLGVIAIFAVDSREMITRLPWIAPYAIMGVLAFSLVAFAGEHCCLICKGRATIDNLMRERERRQQMSSMQDWDCPCGCGPGTGAAKGPEAEAEAEQRQRLHEYAVEKHYRTLFGRERWYRRAWPSPVRTDNTADDTIIRDV